MVSPASVHEIAAISDAVPERAAAREICRRGSSVSKRIAFLLEDSSIHFKDFESHFSAMNALQDYANAFCVITLTNSGFTTQETLALFCELPETWVPNLEDYFCIKYLGNGVSMSPEWVATWNMLTDSQKEFLREKFRTSHLADCDRSREVVLWLLADDVKAMNVMLENDWPESAEVPRASDFISNLTVLAFRAFRRLRALEDDDLLAFEIEAIAQSKTSE